MSEGASGGSKRRNGSNRAAGAGAPIGEADRYFDRSRRPLEILALLAPLILVYEIGLLGALRQQELVVTNRAHSTLLQFFHWVGIRGDHLLLPAMSLPALAVVAVLLAWQVLSRRPWSLHLPTVAAMAIESIATASPVVLLGWLTALIPATAGDSLIERLSVPGRISMAIGAGLYEEFVFRLMLVSLLHSLLKRLTPLGERGAVTLAVILAALAFSLHHPVFRAEGFALHEALFLFGAGCWWGVLLVVRGFGIAVGSHAAYDLWVVLPPLVTASAAS